MPEAALGTAYCRQILLPVISRGKSPSELRRVFPKENRITGRPALAGAIVTAGGVLFVGATDDNHFRALDAKTCKQVWVTKLDQELMRIR